jgi:hypothetical protein
VERIVKRWENTSSGLPSPYHNSVYLLSIYLRHPNAITLIGEGIPEADGPIEASKPVAEVRQAAYPLPKDFEWVTVDVTDEAEVWSGAPLTS